jgi:hypothetical protein
MAEQQAQQDFKTVDIIDFAMQSKPTKVNDAFGQLISNKVVDSLTTRKQEVSAKMFANKEEEPEIEEPTAEIPVEPEAETTEVQQ